MRRQQRLVSVAHSYCVALNRRLANEMARVGRGRWEVTAVAPSYFRGELRDIHLEKQANEPSQLEAVNAYFTKRPHVMLYGSRLRELLSRKWDLVHCWEEPYVLAGGQVARWTPRQVPLVFWTAQNISKTYPPPFNWIERFCIERCSGWLACGTSTVETLLPRGYGRKPYRVLPLGVDLNDFQPDPDARNEIRRQLNWSKEDTVVVGYLGRFVPEKGLRVLSQALDRVPSQWRALFVGSGELEQELRDWGMRYGDQVRIVTNVKHDEVPSYLNTMDVLCAPSQTTPQWREQLGRMLIEAFACGVPVVASDSGEIPYVVEDAGIIVAEADTKAWARELTAILDDASRRAELSKRGLERAHTVYAWEKIAYQHLSFFDELLQSK